MPVQEKNHDKPMQATIDDYAAALASIVLIRSGCDSFPVDTINLLRHMAKIHREGDSVSLIREENGYTVCIPAKNQPDRQLCASLILGLLLDSMGRKYRDGNEEKQLVFVFTCHLLCPRPIFRLADSTWTSVSFLRDFLGMPGHLIRNLARCPSCYVPKEMNLQLLSQFRHMWRRIAANGGINEIPLRKYFTGYEDDEYCLMDRPELQTDKLWKAVNSLIPEHVLTKGHPASLYIEYTEDFSSFVRQFATLDLEILYKLTFEKDPPLPIFGGKPQKGENDYAERMERYLSLESSVRLAMANLLYQRRFHPGAADLLTVSLRKLYETT